MIVGISVWIDRDSYGTDRYCWLRTDNYFIWSFVGPVIVALAANCLFLLMALCVVCRHTNIGYSPCRHDAKTIKNIR
jgi:latrophilin 1